MNTDGRQFEVWARIRSGRLSVSVFGPSTLREAIAAWTADSDCESEHFSSAVAAEAAARNLVSDPEFCGNEFTNSGGVAVAGGRIAGDAVVTSTHGCHSSARPLKRGA